VLDCWAEFKANKSHNIKQIRTEGLTRMIDKEQEDILSVYDKTRTHLGISISPTPSA
jgi:hypothetical protein